MNNLVDFDELWDFDDPKGTEDRMQSLLPNYNNATNLRATLLTQIARAQGLQRKFEEAESTLDKVSKLLDKCTVKERVHYHLEKGRLKNSSGFPQEAKRHFEESYVMAVQNKYDALAVDAAHMIAIVENAEQSLQWNQRALRISTDSKDPKAKRWSASLLNNLGWTYFELQQFENALHAFQQALELRKQHQNQNTIRIAQYAVAKTLRAIGNIQEAWDIMNELVHLSPSDGYFAEEFAECLHALDRNDEAKQYFAQAFEQLSQDPWLNDPVRLQRLKTLSE
jgi:tetratricopeptide (TPR) repeat protein